MARRSKYGEARLEEIAKCKARKTKRLKARRARNARLREQGVKFAKTDAAYKGEVA